MHSRTPAGITAVGYTPLNTKSAQVEGGTQWVTLGEKRGGRGEERGEREGGRERGGEGKLHKDPVNIHRQADSISYNRTVEGNAHAEPHSHSIISEASCSPGGQRNPPLNRYGLSGDGLPFSSQMCSRS